jgi:hypothetical protein
MVTNKIFTNRIYTIMVTSDFFEKKRNLFLKNFHEIYIFEKIFKNKFHFFQKSLVDIIFIIMKNNINISYVIWYNVNRN